MWFDAPSLEVLGKAGEGDVAPRPLTYHQLQNLVAFTRLLGYVRYFHPSDEAAGTEEEAVEAIELLLQLGADVNAVDGRGETAMHGAAYKSRDRLVQFLAENGADVNVWNRKNKRGWTPLMIAEGHRPGNFRPSPSTIIVVRNIMRSAGVEPAAPTASVP